MKTIPASVVPAIFVIGLIVALAGCGPSGPKIVPVSGTVTWNGAPLPDGHIVLIPTAPGEIEAGDKVVNGKFAFKASPGSKKVKIMATRPAGPVDPQMGMPPMEQYLPPKYSSAELTELKAEVVEKGKNEFPFELKP